jgi:hypothetical protein
LPALTDRDTSQKEKNVGSTAATASDLVKLELVLRTRLVRTSTETSAILTEGFRDFSPTSQSSDEINNPTELYEGNLEGGLLYWGPRRIYQVRLWN